MNYQGHRFSGKVMPDDEFHDPLRIHQLGRPALVPSTPQTDKDFETLRWIVEAKGDVVIVIERFHDQDAVKPFAIAPDAVACAASSLC